MNSAKEQCKCTRCRNVHEKEERVMVRCKKDPIVSDSCCPRCGGKSWYKVNPSQPC